MTDELFLLASGSMPTALTYNAYVVNATKFVTQSQDANRQTQNSGSSLEVAKLNRFTVSVTKLLYCRISTDSLQSRCAINDLTRINIKRLKRCQNIASIYTNVEWYKNDPFILSTQAQQVFYTEDLVNEPAWKVVHQHSARHIWDLAYDTVPEAYQETTSANFELFIELLVVEELTYHCPNTIADVVVDDEILSIIATDDDDVDEDLEINDTVAEYPGSDKDSDDDTTNEMVLRCPPFDTKWTGRGYIGHKRRHFQGCWYRGYTL